MLPPYLTPSEAHHTPVRIFTYPHAIPVSYDRVRSLIPAILGSSESRIDTVLHLGMAAGRRSYDIEYHAKRHGYVQSSDMDSEVTQEADCTRHFGDCPETLNSTMDCDEVINMWRSNLRRSRSLPKPIVGRRSEDAGGYICEYILYNSLAWYARSHRVNGNAAERPVLFLHVPPGSSDQDLEVGREVTLQLIRAIAESWAITRRYTLLLGL